MKLWTGRLQTPIDEAANDFNSSIRFDSRMAEEDIAGSLAHAAMLGTQGIISKEDAEAIQTGLAGILADLSSGALAIDPAAEDIHTFIEGELTARIGAAGKRLHTARSRNDQVALDLRLHLLCEIGEIKTLLGAGITALCDQAQKYADAVMPGYTHLQRAQPITLGHHLCAWCAMLLRDLDRLGDVQKRTAVSPLGSGALAGTTYPIDRELAAQKLGLPAVSLNSLDGVSDRDFVIELASAIAVIMMHLSRFCEEIILWCSWEFKFVELSDAFSTGSSMMPQKKNPDIAELIRGKTGRVYGSLITLLTMMKGLPLAYNKDLQEDKQAIFDAVDTVKSCLAVFAPMAAGMTANRDNMRTAAAKGFINATDCADYLVSKGLPFRDAYKITGELVAFCIQQGTTLEDLPLAVYQAKSDLFGQDIFAAISLDACVNGRSSQGGPAPQSVLMQIQMIRESFNG